MTNVEQQLRIISGYRRGQLYSRCLYCKKESKESQFKLLKQHCQHCKVASKAGMRKY